MTLEEYIALVYAQVGDRYILGAEASPSDPDPDVFDCSELVEWSFARAGVKIRDLASNQYADTFPIALAQARPGDLVFLRNNRFRPNGIGHVGIVVGHGTGAPVVEAKGKAYGVIATTLRAWTLKSTYAGIRRHKAFAEKVLPATSASPYPALYLVGDVDTSLRISIIMSAVNLHSMTAASSKSNYLVYVESDRQMAALIQACKVAGCIVASTRWRTIPEAGRQQALIAIVRTMRTPANSVKALINQLIAAKKAAA